MAGRKELANELSNCIRARVPIITIESFEWERVIGVIAHVSREQQYVYLRWNNELGLKIYDHETKQWLTDHELIQDMNAWGIDAIISWFRDELAPKAILQLEDYHHYFNQEHHEDSIDRPVGGQPPWASMWLWRDLARIKPKDMKSIIITGPSFEQTFDLQKEVTALKLDLPDIDDLTVIHNRVVKRMEFEKESETIAKKVVEAARGLTIMEAQTAFQIAGIENDMKLNEDAIPTIIRQKRSVLRNAGGILDYFEPDVNMDDIGGLDNLKQWLTDRKGVISSNARDFGIEPPKGLMLLGVPGCGKSLTAKAIASLWGYPLVRFDISRVFGSLVGQTESQMRNALEVAEAVAPCILWIDEIEKGMAGASGDGSLDSGVTARTFGILLTWLQEKTSPVFVVATCNRIKNFPAEAVRKGRFDEIFFVDLPTREIRKEILKKKITKITARSGTNPDDINLDLLVDETELFSGAELEQVVKDSLFLAFQNEERAVTTEDCLTVISKTVPLAITMKEDIAELRKFAKNRAQPADGVVINTTVEDIIEHENYDDSDFDNLGD